MATTQLTCRTLDGVTARMWARDVGQYSHARLLPPYDGRLPRHGSRCMIVQLDVVRDVERIPPKAYELHDHVKAGK
jgi:hypothetical protein